MSQKDEEGLSVRQRMLADFYLSGMSAVDAALAAGYSGNSVRSTVGPLRLPQVKAYLAAERRRLVSMEGAMDRVELAGWLTRVIRHRMPGSGPDGDLMDSETGEVMEKEGRATRVKSLDKLEAVRQLAKLEGCDRAPKRERKMGALECLLAEIREGR